MTDQFQHAGFWRRLAAYTIDTLPIVAATAGFFYAFLGFDEVWRDYQAGPRDLDARIRFLAHRTAIRNLSFVIWLLYSLAMEASPFQGTLGKVALQIKVVDSSGKRIGIFRSVKRNAYKIITYMTLGVGFVWTGFSKKKQAFHDMLAQTYVVCR